MSQLNYNHLRYFHAVAREGNLTRAAKHLRLSQSALSVQLRSLEQSLGHALFERRNRSLSLTEAGHIALEYAEGIFAAARNWPRCCSNRVMETADCCALAPHQTCRATSSLVLFPRC